MRRFWSIRARRREKRNESIFGDSLKKSNEENFKRITAISYSTLIRPIRPRSLMNN